MSVGSEIDDSCTKCDECFSHLARNSHVSDTAEFRDLHRANCAGMPSSDKCIHCRQTFDSLAAAANLNMTTAFKDFHEQHCRQQLDDKSDEEEPASEINPKAKADPEFHDEVSVWRRRNLYSPDLQEVFDDIKPSIHSTTHKPSNEVMAKYESHFGKKPFYLLLNPMTSLWYHYGDDRLPLATWKAMASNAVPARHFERFGNRVPLPTKLRTDQEFIKGQKQAFDAAQKARTTTSKAPASSPSSPKTSEQNSQKKKPDETETDGENAAEVQSAADANAESVADAKQSAQSEKVGEEAEAGGQERAR